VSAPPCLSTQRKNSKLQSASQLPLHLSAHSRFSDGPNHSAARERASKLVREFERLKSSKAVLEDHFSELQSEMGRLRAEKREVESDIVRHETRHGALEKRLEQIKEQLAEAKSFAVKVEALQAEYKKVQEPSQKLRDSLGKLNNALKGIVKEVSDSETTAAAAQRRANRRNNVAIPAVVMERLARVRLDVEPLRLSVGKLVRERNLLGAEAAG
jgi:chromosome segregation ATPase